MPSVEISLFYRHFIGFTEFPEQHKAENKFQTFWCHSGDFTFFEQYPSIIETWNEQQNQEYHAYANDIQIFHEWLTEELCGDLRADHALVSLDIDRALYWAISIDSIRHQVTVQDFLSRPLRISMYKKEHLVPRII